MSLAPTDSRRLAADEEETDMPLLPRARRRLLDTQADDNEPVMTGRRTPAATQKAPARRATRATSVLSNASEISATPAPRARAPARGKAKQPIVLEESDEEEVSAKTSSKGRSLNKTLEGDSMGRTTRASDSTPVTSTPASTMAGTGRRRLLPADDDDNIMVGLPHFHLSRS
jgi:hypothetical protein